MKSESAPNFSDIFQQRSSVKELNNENAGSQVKSGQNSNMQVFMAGFKNSEYQPSIDSPSRSNVAYSKNSSSEHRKGSHDKSSKHVMSSKELHDKQHLHPEIEV